MFTLYVRVPIIADLCDVLLGKHPEGASNFQKFGDYGQFLIPIVSGVYTLSQGGNGEGVSLVVCTVIQQIVIETLKKVLPKERPNGKLGSFPSGHSAGAFLGVGFLASQHGLSPMVVTALAGAILVGVSRYHSKNHWPIDILAGASIGLAFGTIAGRKFGYGL